MRTMDSLEIFFGKRRNQERLFQKWASFVIENNYNQLSSIKMTVDLVFGGMKRIRMATDVLRVNSNDGIIEYLPLLQDEVDIKSSFTLGSGSPSLRTMNISVDPRLINPADMVFNQGISLSGVGEISLQHADIPYEERFIILRGEMESGITFGADDAEPIDITLTDPAFTSDLIAPSYITSKERFTYISDSWVGKRYPVVYGNNPSVPCIRITNPTVNSEWIIGYGHNLEVNSVVVNSEGIADGTIWYSNQYDVTNAFDKKGTQFTKLKLNTTFPHALKSDATIYANVTGNKISTPDTSVFGTIREIILQDTLIDPHYIDENLFGKSQAKAPLLKVSTVINGSDSENTATGLSYIEETICGNMPMLSMTYTGLGYGPVFVDRRSNVNVLHLIRGQSFIYDINSSVKESAKQDIKNSFVMRYAYNSRDDAWEGLIEINSSNSALCSASETKYGKSEAEPIDNIVVYDVSTAAYIVDWLVSHYSFPRYTIEYIGSPALYFLLSIGDNVLLTDDKLGISSASCTVKALQYSRGQAEIVLDCWVLFDKIAKAT